MRNVVRSLALCGFLWTVACGNDSTSPPGNNLPKCGTALFNISPLPLANITGWVPLGNLNPVAHTFPTDHQYLYYTQGAPLAVVAPAEIYVTRAKRSQYSTGLADYSIEFQPCAEAKAEFGHVSSVDATLEGLLGPYDQNCQTYSPNPGLTVTQCYTKNANVKTIEGTQIGTVGTVATSIALDWWLFDSRATKIVFANNARWQSSSDGFDHFHVVPASDYYAEPVKSQVAAKLGSYNGSVIRTVAPVGGTIAADSTGVQGHWFTFAPTFPESPHLAIARDNVNPSDYAFSVGTSQPGFAGGSFPFTPSVTGPDNLIPAAVTEALGVVCYQAKNNAVVLLQMLGPSAIRLEVRPSTSTCASQQPYVFGSSKTTDYLR